MSDAFTELYDRKTPITAADLLNDRSAMIFLLAGIRLLYSFVLLCPDTGNSTFFFLRCTNPRSKFVLSFPVQTLDASFSLNFNNTAKPRSQAKSRQSKTIPSRR